MLTVIGFSVHDTIVVFDRVRENILRRRFERFEEVVNYSLVQTLARSINTSITVILTLFALYLFGGASIHSFVLALLDRDHIGDVLLDIQRFNAPGHLGEPRVAWSPEGRSAARHECSGSGEG